MSTVRICIDHLLHGHLLNFNEGVLKRCGISYIIVVISKWEKVSIQSLMSVSELKEVISCLLTCTCKLEFLCSTILLLISVNPFQI